MNLQLLNAVLQLDIGEGRVLREAHLFPMTVHRYRDGWTFFLDESGALLMDSRVILGWFFNHPEDVADFLIGELGHRLFYFAIVGDRQ